MALIKVGSLSSMSVSLHLSIVFSIADLVIHDRWLCVIRKFTMMDVSDDLPRCLVHIHNATCLKEPTFASNLRQELILVLEAANPVVLQQLVVIYSVQEGLYRTDWVVQIFNTDC